MLCGGTKGSGLGAIITVDDQPVQIKVAGSSKTALAVTGSVIFGSGSTGLGSSGLPPLPGADTHFFVSGSSGGKDSFGVAVFGGDVVVSGSSFQEGDLSLLQGSRLRFNNPGQNDIFVYANSDNALRIDGDDTVHFLADTGVSFTVNSNEIQIENTKMAINTGAADADFYVNTSGGFGTFFVDGGDNTVIIGNEDFDVTPQASEVSGYAKDVKILLSGTIGTRGTATRGITLISGDAVVSGTLSVNRGQAGAGSAVTVTTDGKVGIGTDNPSYKLEVGGNASFGEYLYHRNNAGGQNTFMRFEDDKISFDAGGKNMLDEKKGPKNSARGARAWKIDALCR